MRALKSIHRGFIAAVVGIATVATTSMVASAATADLPGFICAAATQAGNLTVCVKADIQAVQNTSTTEVVTVTCEAVVEGAVASTSTGCQLNGLTDGQDHGNAPSVAIPGSVAVTSIPSPLENPPGLLIVPVQPYQICVGGNYESLNSQVGNPTNWAAYGCFTAVV